MSRTTTNIERERFLADMHVGMISIAEDGRGPLIVPIWYGYAPGGGLSVFLSVQKLFFNTLTSIRSVAMYNPDQHYEAHIFHLKELSAQAEQHRMIAVLMQNRSARIRAAGRRLGVVLVRLGTWLSRNARSSRPNLGWRVSRKPDGWGRAVAMPSSACANTRGVCDAGDNQPCA
jgi:hypothetical protein